LLGKLLENKVLDIRLQSVDIIGKLSGYLERQLKAMVA